jgi:hypothetical protein
MSTTEAAPAATAPEAVEAVHAAQPLPVTPAPAPVVGGMPGLYAALARAIERAKGVKNDSKNTHHGYSYTSAEAILEEARGALAAEGLCVIQRSWRIRPRDVEAPQDGKPPGYFGDLIVVYRVAHAGGGEMECEAETPIISERGRPEDKASHAALTFSLGYFVRGLLLLPRPDAAENDVDQRDDRNYEPRGQQGGGQRGQQGQRGAALPDPRNGNGRGQDRQQQGQQQPAGDARAFDSTAAILSMTKARTEEELRAVAETFKDVPPAQRKTLEGVYSARRDELRAAAAAAGSPPPADAPTTTPATAPAPAATAVPATTPTVVPAPVEAAPPPPADKTWTDFLGDLRPIARSDTSQWSEEDILVEFGSIIGAATSRSQLNVVGLPWLGAARKRSSSARVKPVADEVKRMFDERSRQLRDGEAGAA